MVFTVQAREAVIEPEDAHGGSRMMNKLANESIASQVIPEVKFSFKSTIDLMDESLREGAERATVPPSIEDKCDLAEAIIRTGVRTLVVGMFPDVPHNIELLRQLVKRQQAGRIAPDARFMVISHVGITFEQSLTVLNELAEGGMPLKTVWLIAIHSVSDQQIQHLFPTILRKIQPQALTQPSGIPTASIPGAS